MIKKHNFKQTISFSILILSTLLMTPNSTLAVQPENVDVVIRITWFDSLLVDKDVGAADVYFKIKHDTGTSSSGVAKNDYSAIGDYELDNNDFDGNGYYNQQYWDVDLDTGDLTWTIEVWDQDVGADDLLFNGTLTIKDPGTSGSHSTDPVYAYGSWVWIGGGWVDMSYGTNNNYMYFEWVDGPLYDTGTVKTSNGLKLWVSL